MWLASTCAIVASTVNASTMMETADEVVYCNSPPVTTVAASPDTPSSMPMSAAIGHDSSSASSERSSPSLESVASSPSPSSPAPFYPAQPASPAPVSIASSSPAPSSPAPSSPAPSFPAAPLSPAPMYPASGTSPAPSSPLPLSPAPSSPAPSSPAPSSPTPLPMEYEPAVMIQTDEDEYDEEDGNDDDNDGDDDDDDDDEDDDYNSNNDINIVSDGAEVTDQGEDEDDSPPGGRRRDCFADSLIALKEVKQLQSILLLHLDLIQEQGDQILTKDKMIVKLRDENEVLKHQLDLSNKRLALMLLQLQQNGVQFPLDLQQQQQQQQQLLLMQQQQQQQQQLPQQQHPKPEGTVSPLTIRSQMENGRRRGVVLKSSSSSSSSPPSVSSSFVEGVYGQCLPIRNSEVSSTVSPAKEELGDDLVLLQQHPYYQPPTLEDDEAAFIAENNEVDGEICLNYSKSDDDESPSPATSYGEEEDDDEGLEEEEADGDGNYFDGVQEHELHGDEEDDDVELQDHDAVHEIHDEHGQPLVQYDGELPDDEVMEGGYETSGSAEDDYPMQYVSVEQSNYEDAPMMMMMMMMDNDDNDEDDDGADADDGAAEVGMIDSNSQGSQESQHSQESLMQQAGSVPAVHDMAVNVQFVESTVGSEGEQPLEGEEDEEDDEEEDEVEEQEEQDDEEEEEEEQEEYDGGETEFTEQQQDESVATAAAPAMVVGQDQDTMETTYDNNNETNEGEVGAESEPEVKDEPVIKEEDEQEQQQQEHQHQFQQLQHAFNPADHCPSGNSSDGSVAKRGCKSNAAYMVTHKQYISCSWKDDAVTAELERLLSNEAAELEIPSWNVIDDSSQSADDQLAPARENISDEAYMKRHTKLEIDERRRKKWDVQRIREQKNIERLKKRQLKEQPAEQEAQKTITSFYPTVDTLKYIVITDDVPVQAFGELIPLLPAPATFSLPWLQPTSSNGGLLAPPPGSSSFGHPAQFPGSSAVDRVAGSSEKLQHETKTKFLHRLAPNLQAQKQRFTKRIKKEL